MSKIKGKVIFNKQDIIKIKGILNKNHLIFKENDILVTIDILGNKIVMKRATDDYKITLSLIKNKITKNKYNIKNVGSVVIEIKTLNLKIDNNFIDIEYLVIDSGETFNYQVKYEIMEE